MAMRMPVPVPVLVPMLVPVIVAGIRKQPVGVSGTPVEDLVHNDIDDEPCSCGNEHHKGFLHEALVDDP